MKLYVGSFTPKRLPFVLKFLCNCCFIDKLEGDIKLTPNVETIVAEGVKEKKKTQQSERGVVSDQIYLWTNGRVPYVIDGAFSK